MLKCRKTCLAIVCIALSSGLLASAGYIHVKAMLAQWLIADAWQQTLQTHSQHTPWSWADMFPVATLSISNEQIIVLAGSTGRTLAFGPGHMSSTPLPGQLGNAVITGHRDTHFSVLKNIMPGDVITTETLAGKSHFSVSHTQVVHKNDMHVLASSDQTELTLITCFPFDSVQPNPEYRYVVNAKLISEPPQNVLRIAYRF